MSQHGIGTATTADHRTLDRRSVAVIAGHEEAIAEGNGLPYL
jgi:hypothetical protein